MAGARRSTRLRNPLPPLGWPKRFGPRRPCSLTSGLPTSVRATLSRTLRPAPLLWTRDRQHVAQEDGTLRRNQLAGTHSLENLPIVVPLHPDLHGTAGETSPVRRHPDGHRPIPLTHHTPHRNCRRTHGVTRADHKIGEHPGPQL